MKKVMVLMVIPVCFWSLVAAGVTFNDPVGITSGNDNAIAPVETTSGNNDIFAPAEISGYDDITLSLATGEDAAREIIERMVKAIFKKSMLETVLSNAGITAKQATAFTNALIETYGGEKEQAAVALKKFTEQALKDQESLKQSVAKILENVNEAGIDKSRLTNVVSGLKEDAVDALKITVADAIKDSVVMAAVGKQTTRVVGQSTNWDQAVTDCIADIKAAYGNPAIDDQSILVKIISVYTGKSYGDVSKAVQTDEDYNSLKDEIDNLSGKQGNNVVAFLNEAL